MLVTNTTAHCFVLSAGVIIQPNASDVVVSDTTYQTDSTLNQQLDALEAEGFVSITGKPTDPFPPPVQSDVDGQVTLTASASDKTPLTVVANDSQTANLLEVFDGDSLRMVSIDPSGVIQVGDDDVTYGLAVLSTGVLRLHPVGGSPKVTLATNPATQLTMTAVADQTANLLEAYNENGDLVLKVSAGGDLTVESGAAIGSLQADSVATPHVVTINDNAALVPLTVAAATAQTANLIEAYDEDGNLVVSLLSDADSQTELDITAPGNGIAKILMSEGDGGVIGLSTWDGVVLQPKNPGAPKLAIHAATSQTANLLEVYDEDGNLILNLLPNGTLQQVGQYGANPANHDVGVQIGGGGLTTNALHTADVPLKVNAHADGGQVGNLVEVYDDDANLILSTGPDGFTSAIGKIGVTGSDAGVIPLSVKAANAQTAAIVVVVDNSNNQLFRIDADGTVHIKTGGTIHADL